MDSIINVCRLCLTTQNLKWVFDLKLNCVEEVNLIDLISIITGIKIIPEDKISQKICMKCYQIFIEVNQYRKSARKNNETLMDRYNEMLKTSHKTKTKKKVKLNMETKEVDKPIYKIHQSVKDLRKQFPLLNLPSTVLECNIKPCIILERDTVKNFLKKKDRNERRRTKLSKSDRKIKNSTAASIVIDRLKNSSLSTMNTERSSESNSVVSGIVGEDLSNGGSDRDLSVIHKNTVNPKKRRLADNDSSSSEPLPKKKPPEEFAEELCLEKSVPLFICNICGSGYNNEGELKRHHFRHLRCLFCSSQFTSLDSKYAHIESMCETKNHLPSVELEKIEFDQRIRAKYPDAFIGYPLISDPQLDPTSTEDEVSRNNILRNDEKAVNDGEYNDNVAVIEISANYDASLPPGNDVSDNAPLFLKEMVPLQKYTQSKIDSFFLPTNSTATEKVSSTVLSVIPNSSSVIATTSSIISTTHSVISSDSSVISTTSPAISNHLNVSHTVIPDISILNSNINFNDLDEITLDTSVEDIIRELLTTFTPITEEQSSQTESSCRQPTCLNKSDKTIELKNFNDLLFLYAIPFVLEKGDFRVRCNNTTNSKPQQAKKLHMWNDLTPIDVNIARSSQNEVSIQDNIPATTSELTKNFTTTGTTRNFLESTIYPSYSLFSADPNLQPTGRNNRFSSPVNDLSVSCTVDGDIYFSSDHHTSLPNISNITHIRGKAKEPFPNMTPKPVNNELPSHSTVMENVSPLIFTTTPVISTMPTVTSTLPSALSSTPSNVPSTCSFISTIYNSSNYYKPQQPKKLCLWNDMNPISVNVVNKSGNNASSTQYRAPVINPEVRSVKLPSPEIASTFTNATMSMVNSPLFTLPVQQTCSSINRSLPPVNCSTGLSNVNVHPQVVPSSLRIVSVDSCSGNPTYIRVQVGQNADKQQSNTSTVNSFTSSDIQKKISNTTSGQSNYLVARDPTYIHPQATIAGLQPTLYSYDKSSIDNVNPVTIPNLTLPETSSVASYSLMNSTSNARNTQSMIFNQRESDTVHNNMPDMVHTPVTFTTAPVSNEARPLYGRIRVRNLQDMM